MCRRCSDSCISSMSPPDPSPKEDQNQQKGQRDWFTVCNSTKNHFITINLQCVTYKNVNEFDSVNQVALSCPRVRQGLWKAIHFQVPTEAFLERPSSTNNILQHLSVVTMNVTCWFLQLYPRPSPQERTQYLQSLFLSARSYSHQGARKQKPQNSAGI